MSLEILLYKYITSRGSYGYFKKLASATLGILIVVLCAATFLDQSISKHLMDQNSLFGTIFQNYGLFPPTFVLIISMIILTIMCLRHLKIDWHKLSF